MSIDILDFSEVELPALPQGKRLTLERHIADTSEDVNKGAGENDVAEQRWTDAGWSGEDAEVWRALEAYCQGEELPVASPGEPSLSGKLWPAASVLCEWLVLQHEELSACSVLELGAGTGACGLFAAALGATRVLLTDAPGAESMQLLEANVQANAWLWDSAAHVAVAPLLWGAGQLPPERVAANAWGIVAGGDKARFDWVIASDCTYGDASCPLALAHTLAELLRPCSNASSPRVVLAHEHRSGDRALHDATLRWSPIEGDEEYAAFAKAAAKHQLALRPLVSRRPRARRKGAFTCWSADVTIIEVVLAELQ